MTRSRALDALTYNVARLMTETPGAERTYPVASVIVDLGPDLRQADPLEGTVRLVRTNRGLLVFAKLRTSIAEICSRCLKEIEVPVEVTIEEEALPSIDIATGLPVDTLAEPDVLRLTDHHELELEPVVRDEIQLAEPIAPVCRPDCPGLCVVCGRELAQGDHEHLDEPIDPRLEALRGFRVDPERKDA